MCGIFGKVNCHFENKVNRREIEDSCRTIEHRGPDHTGIYVEDNVGLGHLRLSIIDLSTCANQPMCNEDGTVWIVFNGEIYNFRDLKDDLVRKGHHFASHSDTEVIVHLYEEYGYACLDLLRGMFAFGIWDDNKKRLLLARDRVGKKPLHYTVVDNNITFASEIKAILEDRSVARKVNYEAIYYYNTFNYIPTPFTAFEGIHKLPPAHYLVYEAGEISVQRYWNIDYSQKFEIKNKRDFDNLLDEINFQIEEATKIRLISDVPVGAFLSGGVDSSAVVAYAGKHAGKGFKTFSIRFNERDYDESQYAKQVAEKFGTEHHEFVVKPDALEVMDKLVWHYDEPFADSSSIPTYYVSRMAREYVTVALTGDGGDENFGGYPRYAANDLSEKLNRMPLYQRLLGSDRTLGWLNSYNNYHSPVSRMKRLARISTFPDYKRYFHWTSWNHYNLLFSKDFEEKVDIQSGLEMVKNLFMKANTANVVDRSLYADMNMYLPDDLLVKVDIASMANSLELRCPLLDHKLMEFAAKIPANLKVKHATTKFVMKKALERILPHDILYRKKMGFGLPVEHWFRNELKELIYDTILSNRFFERGYYNKEYISNIINEHMTLKRNNRFEIWNLLMLELWHRKFID